MINPNDIKSEIEQVKAMLASDSTIEYDDPALLPAIAAISEYYTRLIEQAEFPLNTQYELEQANFNAIVEAFIERKKKEHLDDKENFKAFEIFCRLSLAEQSTLYEPEIINKLIAELANEFSNMTVNNVSDYEECIRHHAILTQLLELIQKERRNVEDYPITADAEVSIIFAIPKLFDIETNFIKQQIARLQSSSDIDDTLIKNSKAILKLIPEEQSTERENLSTAIEQEENDGDRCAKISAFFDSFKMVERYHHRAFKKKDPLLTFLRENTRKKDIDFLQLFINKVNSDEALDSYQRLKLLKDAIKYISDSMEVSWDSIGVGHFKNMLGELNGGLDKAVSEAGTLFVKTKIENCNISFKEYVEKHQVTFGVEDKWVKKISKELEKQKLESSGLSA